MKNLKGLVLSALVVMLVVGNAGNASNFRRGLQLNRGRGGEKAAVIILHEPNPALR